MFFWLQDLPIKRKLMVVILLTSSFALLLMGSALVFYERFTFRRSVARDMNVLGQIIGSNSTAALAFDDPKSAHEILSGLLAEKQIAAAAIYDNHGTLFAKFPDTVAENQLPPQPGPLGHKIERRRFVTFQPILQEGVRVGTIYLQADLGEMYARFRVYGLLLLFVGICSTLAALALATRLQRSISNPILDLAKVAAAVSEGHDYSVRGTKYGRDEIGQLTDAFNEMLARLGQSNAALAASEEELRLANKEKDNFLAVLSHELRTPLTPVLAAAAMLKDDKTVPEHLQEEIDMIRRNIELEARLIDDLLDVNRIVHGKLDLNRQVVDLRDLVDHAIKSYCQVAAAKKNIKCVKEITATETHVLVDSSRLTQVLWNLFQNACKFTPAGGKISVRVYNEKQKPSGETTVHHDTDHPPLDVVVQVTDTGMGISPETLPRIFNAFEQGTRSRDQTFGGLGLGLSISRAIMELHDGTIFAASEGKDQGSTFTIRLQTVKPVARAEAEKSPPSYSGRTSALSLRVLVVEDHLDTAEQFARLLRRAGHEVVCATSIREAQTHAAGPAAKDGDCAFDVLISDVDLPDGSGRDLMRSLAQRCPIYGIAISGHGMKEDVESSLAAGFSTHITKPVDWEKLKAAMQSIAEDIGQRDQRPAAT